jgi:hypothetical protein
LNAAAGQYYISFRYALDASPRPLSLFVNSVEVLQTAANPIITVSVYGSNPTDHYPLERCAGDCDNDDHCAGRLICHQNNGLLGQEVPGCSGFDTGSTDYCVDPNDYTHGILFKPTGGWDDDWLHTEKIEVTLLSGANTIRLQIPPGYDAGPNIDFMKVEGMPSANSSLSFRNPPHFMSERHLLFALLNHPINHSTLYFLLQA